MTRWGPAWLVAKREVMARMRNRSYQLSTLAVIVVAFAAVGASEVLPDIFGDEDELRIGVLPAAEPLRGALLETASAFGQDLELVSLGADSDLAAAIDREDLDAVLADQDRLVFEDSADTTLQAIVAQAAFEEALPGRARSLGLSLEDARSLIQPVDVSVDLLAPGAADEDVPSTLSFLSSLLLLTAISLYGGWVLVGVIEEKSNRVVEVLLAVVAPWQLLTGKVLGIMALAVIQLAAGLIAIYAGFTMFAEASLPEAGLSAIVMASTWLVLGLLLYNFLYAAVGATATRPEDATSAQVPVLTPLMISYFLSLSYVTQNPDTLLSRALSLFPLSAPLVMPVRVAEDAVGPIEVAVAIAATMATIAGTAWLAARIYSGAILQTQRLGLLAAFKRARTG